MHNSELVITAIYYDYLGTLSTMQKMRYEHFQQKKKTESNKTVCQLYLSTASGFIDGGSWSDVNWSQITLLCRKTIAMPFSALICRQRVQCTGSPWLTYAVHPFYEAPSMELKWTWSVDHFIFFVLFLWFVVWFWPPNLALNSCICFESDIRCRPTSQSCWSGIFHRPDCSELLNLAWSMLT